MKITPLEIRQKTFEKIFRGYDKDEVNAYLLSLSQEWERILDENKELSLRIESLEKEVSRLRDVESSLFKTLKTAEDTGANLVEQAKKETELKIKESQIKAEEIVNQARIKAKSMINNAESKSRQILDEMIGKLKLLEQRYNDISELREKVTAQIKNYASELQNRIEKLEKKSANNHVDTILTEAREIYNAAMLDVESIAQGDLMNKKPEKKPDSQVLESEASPENEENNDEVEMSQVEETAEEKEENKKTPGKSFFDEIE